MLRDLLLAIVPTAHRFDVRVGSALPLLDTTARQLLAQEILLRYDCPLPITDLALELGCTRPAARQTIARLVENDRATLTPARDARSRNVKISELGRDLIGEEWDLATNEIVQAFIGWEDAEIAALVGMLQRLNERTKRLFRARAR